MRIFFICKRYYTGKDVIGHKFGRLYEMPRQLALLGHDVTVLCLDYRSSGAKEDFSELSGSKLIRWISIPLKKFFSLKTFSIYREISAGRPEIVIGSSDIPCLWLARKFSSKFKIPYIIDLYDNYESFGQANIPFFRRMLRRSVKDASVIIVVSDALKNKVHRDYSPLGAVVVMNNGISLGSFFAGDKVSARLQLGLPLDMCLVGTAGTLSRAKGLDTVFEAWQDLKKQREDVCLILAGPVEANFCMPDEARVFYLGELLEAQVGMLFRALDVGIISAHDSEFGRYCFPQKLYEMVACELPIVAADIGAIACILEDSPKILFAPGRAEELVETLMLQIQEPQLVNVKVKEWRDLITKIESFLLNLSQHG